MERNMEKLVEFKKRAATALLSDNGAPAMMFVAVKYSGDISVLNSNDKDMINVLPTMTGKRNPYFVWRLFSTQKEAEDYERQLRSIEVSQFIPPDPMEVKAAR